LNSSSGDHLDFRDLLSYTAEQDLASFIHVTDAGAGSNVTLKIDTNGAIGGVDFTNPNQTIILGDVGTGSINLSYLEDHAILL